LDNFTPLSSFSGGLLVGLAATLLLLFNGRIAGISGIMSGLISPGKGEILWRLIFLLGIVLGALLVNTAIPESIIIREGFPYGLLFIGGFLVGFGTRMANGCTSGHAVCGIARRSKRSFAATLTFIVSGMLTVYFLRHVLGLSV
jgi:uncharacterized membrane protein YedE/YeeE